MIRKSLFGTASMLSLAGLLSFAGCSSDANSDNGTGTEHNGSSEHTGLGGIGLGLTLADGSDVQAVNYTITRNGATVRTGVLAIDSTGHATGTITGLDAGAGYSIALHADRTRGDAGVEGCDGSATFTVVSAQTTPVAVLLQCSDTSVDTGNITINGTFNVCPKIGVATASPSTQSVGSSIALSVSATDKDSDPLTYSWFTGATFSSGAVFATGATASYSCTAPGTFTLNVQVSDGPARGCSKVLTTPISVTCTGASIDAGVPPAVDSSVPPAVDSSVPPTVDSSVPPAVDSSVPPAVDSSVPPAPDSSVPPSTFPYGSAACVSCQTTNCTLYGVDEVPTLANCTDSACRALVKCELDNHCFKNVSEPLLCYCGGTGQAGIDACTANAAGFAASGPCKSLVETGLGTTVVSTILQNFIDPGFPVGLANQLTTCIGDLCATACAL